MATRTNLAALLLTFVLAACSQTAYRTPDNVWVGPSQEVHRVERIETICHYQTLEGLSTSGPFWVSLEHAGDLDDPITGVVIDGGPRVPTSFQLDRESRTVSVRVPGIDPGEYLLAGYCVTELPSLVKRAASPNRED